MPLPTNVQMENKGYRLLGNTAEIVVNPIAGLGVHEDKIKRDPDLIKRTIRASLRSLQLLQADAQETVRILMDRTRASEKDAPARSILPNPASAKMVFSPTTNSASSGVSFNSRLENQCAGFHRL